jgi:hypothetical protein
LFPYLASESHDISEEMFPTRRKQGDNRALQRIGREFQAPRREDVFRPARRSPELSCRGVAWVDEHVLNARVTHVDRVVSRGGRVALVLALDCSYLTLLHFMSALGTNQVKQRKREKKGLPASTLRLRTSLVVDGERRAVDAEIGLVSPLDANAVVSIAEMPGFTPAIGSTLEFSLDRDGPPGAG